jgi:hypothetical protein
VAKPSKHEQAGLQRKCQAHGERVFAAWKAKGPIVFGVITLAAAIADPEWFARAKRDQAIAKCIENGGRA